MKSFFGLEIYYCSSVGISLYHRKYALELLQDADLLGIKSAIYQMDQNIKLLKDNGDLLPDPTMF